MSELYNVMLPGRARGIMDSIAVDFPREAESIDFLSSNGRILAENVYANSDLPGFARSTMDGFAVRSKDIFGASESMPIYLTCREEILMGMNSGSVSLSENSCVRIWTGGMMPRGADAVVMIEHTQNFGEDMVEVFRQCAPGENVIDYNEDISVGSIVLKKGHHMRSQDIGCLAALGIMQVDVFRKIRVAIISTGDEIISPESTPGPGQIRDVNSYALFSSMSHPYLSPVIFGRVGDEAEDLESILSAALLEFDCILISGGSSVGVRDNTMKILSNMTDNEVFFHGISVRPGKPTILAKVAGKPIIGLPGPPASAFIIFDFFIMPFLQKLAGMDCCIHKKCIEVRAGMNIPSVAGREDYVRVRIVEDEQGILIAEPVYAKSAMISSLIGSDGVIMIGENTEGIHEGERVKVYLYGG